jgi:hypothetical protein
MNFYLCIWFKMYKLRDWVDETRLMFTLSRNECAVEYLENHKYLIDNLEIFKNNYAMNIIEKRIQYDVYNRVNYNKNAVNFLRNNRQYIDYNILCGEEHGIEFVDELIKNNELEKIDWCRLSENPAAMHILNDPNYFNYIDWQNILYNTNAIELVKNNLQMIHYYIYHHSYIIDIIEHNENNCIYWYHICQHPYLIDIIEQNMDRINWTSLSINYNAIHILEKNLDKININQLFWNKNGFLLLLKLNHVFTNNNNYHKNIVLDYFDYCEIHNIPFNLIRQLSEHGFNQKHIDFLKHNNDYEYLSINPNIFEYDYKRMRETRQALLWYNDIKK